MAASTGWRLGKKIVTAGAALAGVAGGALYLSNQEQYARCWSSNAHLKFPASSNYPDLTKHNNVMADTLTPAVRH